MSTDSQDFFRRLEQLAHRDALTEQQRTEAYSIAGSTDSEGAQLAAASNPVPIPLYQQYTQQAPGSREVYYGKLAAFLAQLPPESCADWQELFAGTGAQAAIKTATRRQSVLATDQQQAAQPKIARQASSGRSREGWQELVLGELQRHHDFDGDSILNMEPAKQIDLCTTLGLDEKQKPRISEAIIDLFGNHKDYCNLCRNRDKLLEKLQRLTGQTPQARGEADRIDGLQCSDEELIDAVLDRAPAERGS